MTGRRKIYVVTSGEYSDYHICAVYLDETEAERFVAHVGGNIEDWEESLPYEQLNKIETIMRLDNGDVVDSLPMYEPAPPSNKSRYGLLSICDVTIEHHFDASQKRFLAVVALGVDEAHAIKRAGDARRAILAIGVDKVTASVRW